MRKFIPALFIVFLFCSFKTQALSQTRIELDQELTGPARGAAAGAHYRYLFENPRFTVPVQELEFDGSGQGKFRFKRKDSDEIVNKLTVSSEVLTQIQLLFDDLNFLASDEEYQHKKDFSHLGNMTITYSRDGKERTVKFNYTDNQSMSRLNDIFRNLVTQETRIFELEAVIANDPISAPQQLRMLESELKSKRVADPHRFDPILKNIKLDEGVPLIARNHADRLLLLISKGK
ncbi:MAG TPA: hypothetical protein VFS27_03360 [Blastocatellia bacterium]|jgi:hypothetical protein|nr:hypothetical protein [Blastocatellia bacterium]